jgi:transcription antitermination factor NusG
VGGPVRTFVAQTKQRKEHVALVNLERQGFAAFLPLIKRPRPAAQKSGRLTPLFPGYIFVDFDPLSDPWLSINGTLGVIRLIANGPSTPAAIPFEVIQAVRRRCVDGFFTPDRNKLAVGDRIQITDGPFANLLGRVASLNSLERVSVLLEILGGSIVALPNAQVEAVAA